MIHKQNKGISEARNDGIEASSAKYIMFVDSDDWVDPQFCEIPYRIASENVANMVMFRHRWYFGDTEGTQHHSMFREGIVSKEDAMEMIHDSEIGWMSWNKMYDRDVISNIRFPAGRVHEDIGTTYKAIDRSERIVYSHAVLYNYYALRPGSLTSTINNNEMRDWLVMWARERNDLKRMGYRKYDYFTDEAFTRLIKYGRSEGLTADFRSTVKELLKTTEGFTDDQMRLFKIYRISPHLFAFIINSKERLQRFGIEIPDLE